MDRAEIYGKVVAIIARVLKLSPEHINEESDLEQLGADSLNRVEFIMDLEEAFEVEIDDDEAENLATIGQAVTYIYRLQEKEEA